MPKYSHTNPATSATQSQPSHYSNPTTPHQPQSSAAPQLTTHATHATHNLPPLALSLPIPSRCPHSRRSRRTGLRNLLAPRLHRSLLKLLSPATQLRVGVRFVYYLVVFSLLLPVLLVAFIIKAIVGHFTDPTAGLGLDLEPDTRERTIAEVANDDVIEALEEEIAVLSRQYRELTEEATTLRNTSAGLAKAQKKATKLEAQAARINTRRMKLNEQLLKRGERNDFL